MTWSIFANNFETAEMSNADKYQTMQFGENILIRYIRTWIVLYNNPTFTNLNCKIYSNEVIDGDNFPGQLIATSTDVRTKEEILLTEENGAKEIYFTFADVPFEKDTIYNIVINGTGYTGSDTSHIAWVKAFPDPIHPGYTPSLETLPVAPYQVYPIGADI